MADNNEEEYLDALLKSMLNGDEDDTPVEVSSPIEKYDSSEDDDMAMLSRMLLEDNDIAFDDDSNDGEDLSNNNPPPIEHSDMESFFSLDDLLDLATNNETGAVSASEDEEEPEITPIMSEDFPNLSEPVDDADEAVQEELADEEPAKEELEDEGAADLEALLNSELEAMSEGSDGEAEDDFFGDFDEIGAMFSNENTMVNEEALRRAMIESDEPMVHDSELEKELADILSLDEGMSLSDIPDEQQGNALTEEEKQKIQAIDTTSEQEALEEEPVKKGKSLFSKKAKKEKQPKEKKEKAAKAKKADAAKPQKEKSKFSFKEFFSKFNDEEEEVQSADNNQKLIDDLYKNKKSLDDEEFDEEGNGKKGKKGKKEKKPKTPKPKKEKKPKNVLPDEKVQVGKLGVAIITLLFILFLFGGFFGVRFINYQLTINSAKKYFEMGNYDLAYDNVSGLDIMSKDDKLYNKIRTVMIVYQGYVSYNNYIELDREAEALDALINAVGRKQQAESDTLLYQVSDEVDAVYEQILSILEFYEIDEQMALDMYMMTNYEEYMELLHSYEGVAQ